MDKEQIFNEIELHLLQDEKPSKYLNELKDNNGLSLAPFNLLKNLEEIQQAPKHHPEGNVWIHTMMVVDKGAEYRNFVNDKRVFMWALLLHDLGKLTTTKMRHGRWTSYDHDKVGEMEAKKFLEAFDLKEEFILKVIKLVRYHMQLLFLVKNMPYGNEEGMKKEANLHDLSYVFLSDRLGRGGITQDEEADVEKQVEWFKDKYVKK